MVCRLLATDEGVRVLDVSGTEAADARPVLAGRRVDDLAIGRNGWWAVVDGHELWHTSPDGRVEQVASLSGPAVRCVAVEDGTAVVGTDEAHLLRVEGSAAEPLTGFDKAESRASWYTPWGGPPAVRTIATADDGTLYVNVHVGGILRSDDAGASWWPTIDLEADVHEVTTVPGRPDTVVAATARGLAVSHDRGGTWAVTDSGLHATYCRAVAVGGETVYLSASTGPSSTSAAVYRGSLHGDELVRCTTGLPEWFPANVDSRCLAARNDGTVVLGAPGGEVYASADEGETWTRLVTGLPTIRAVAIP